MKRRRLLSIVLLFFVLVGSFMIRMIDYSMFRQEMRFLGDYYRLAIVGDVGIYCIQNISLNEIYTMLLSVMMYVFGNGESAAIIMNIICQLLIVLLVYAIAFVWSNSYVASIIAMGMSIILLFTDKMYEVSRFHLSIIAVLLLIYGICLITKNLYVKRNRDTLKSRTIDATYESDEINTVITLDDILGEERKKDETETLLVSETLQEVPKGMTEIQMEEAEKKATQFIENPLPVPKRKEHKQMDYIIDSLSDNDDFDITDMTGMDFFDIE